MEEIPLPLVKPSSSSSIVLPLPRMWNCWDPVVAWTVAPGTKKTEATKLWFQGWFHSGYSLIQLFIIPVMSRLKLASSSWYPSQHDVSGKLASTTTEHQISIDFFYPNRPNAHRSHPWPPSRSEASACVAVVGSAAFASSVARPEQRQNSKNAT